MTISSRKRSNTEQAVPEQRKRVRIEHDTASSKDNVKVEPTIPNQASSSRKRFKHGKSNGKKNEHVRKHQHGLTASANITSNTDNVDTTKRTANPPSPKKRSSTHLDGNNDDPKLKANSRAIYDANKKEIDTWCDETYSFEKGIPKHGKLLHSKAQWYEKLASWQKAHGQSHTPEKKRKLNNGVAQPVKKQPQTTKQRRETRLPDDKVDVPEYPFDKLEDYEAMPNGNYACAHFNRNPPGDCCKHGLSKRGKLEAIKKSIDVWKRQVERLIYDGKLDGKHKDWKNWVVEKLRKKYQPDLFKKQEAEKEEKLKARRQQEQREREWAEKRKAEKKKAEKGNVVPQHRRRPDSKPAKYGHYQHASARPASKDIRPPTLRGIAPEPIHVVEARRQQSKSSKLFVSDVQTSSQLSCRPVSTPELHSRRATPDVKLEGKPSSIALCTITTNDEAQAADHAPITEATPEAMSAPTMVPVTEVTTQKLMPVRSEISYLTSLPLAFAIDNGSVDAEMVAMLRKAYQTDSTWMILSEDEQLFHKLAEQSKAYWQRYREMKSQL